LHDAAVVEIVSSAGFNIALIDKEHASLEMRDGEAALTAACRTVPTAPLVFDF
jgi:2-keto-3-deoxy-L-rhamnonate aldolase RhmA